VNYRPSARQGSAYDTGMSHIGFRCVTTPDMVKWSPPQIHPWNVCHCILCNFPTVIYKTLLNIRTVLRLDMFQWLGKFRNNYREQHRVGQKKGVLLLWLEISLGLLLVVLLLFVVKIFLGW